ncbi:aspartate 1-decarboxylase [Noviherbaspirillum denitrificans]|uniref:aspartate 1-decarboxylase n=1 Tax=Noviherbaspirillum denitrificans TaxID=1968433 RepID=UPI001131332E
MQRLLYSKIVHDPGFTNDAVDSCACAVDPRLLGELGLHQVREIEIYNMSTNERIRMSASVVEMEIPAVWVNDAVATRFQYGDLCIVSSTDPLMNNRVPFACARYYAKKNDASPYVDKHSCRVDLERARPIT